MTLKHIDFHDSPVMRELERQAFKKGTVVTPVADIVKKASAQKRFASTGELFVDLIRLAEGLRERGFSDQATVLESKIFAYKKAAQEYNSELSAAHPDGDVTMGEASNGLGDVETLESAHEKMVEVVNKKPTGKQAALIANILKASEEALELKKKAQAGDESAEDVFSGKSAATAATIKEINDFLTAEFPKIAGILKSRDLDLSKWVFRYTDIFNGSPAFRALYASRAGLNPASVEKFFQDNEKLYGKGFTGDEQTKILGTLQTYAKQKDFNKLSEYAGIVGRDIASKFFYGSQPSTAKKEYATEHPDKANNQMFRDNPNSVWKWYSANIWQGAYDSFGVDDSKLTAAAREIQQAHYEDFQALFGNDKLSAATGKIQEEIKAITVPWDEVAAFFEKNPELPPNISSIASLAMAINSQIDKLKPYGADGALNKKLMELAAIFWPGWTPNLAAKATEAAREIVATVAFLNSKPLSQGDVIVQDTSKAVSALMGAAKMYWEAGKQVNPKSPTAKEYAQNQRVTFNLAKAVRAGAGKPYAALYEAVKPIFPNATTYEKLVQEAQAWLQESANTTGYPAEEFAVSASEKLKPAALHKVAEGLIRKPGKGGGGPTRPAGDTKDVPGDAKPAAPSGGGGNRATLGLAKANMNDPKEVAVATMQQHLAYFAEYLAKETSRAKFKDYDPQDVARIVRTGPKANPAVNTYDGKWGSETQAALELANKYLKQLGIEGLDTKARYVNRVTSADAEAAAKKNASLLSQATQMLGGAAAGTQAGASTLYDKLPDRIDWNTVEYPLMQHRIPVTAQDMSSLAAMYDLVTKNNWAQPKFTRSAEGFDVEGFTAGNLLFIIRWFQKRAQFVYNASVRTDKTAAALARQYYEAAKRLEGQLAAFLSSRGGLSPEGGISMNTQNTIVDIEDLREHAAASAGIGGGPGQGQGQGVGGTGFAGGRGRVPGGAGYQYANYRPGGAGGEGMDWRSPTGGGDEGPPIGPDGTINLASRWFGGLDEKLGISHNPLLNPDVFKRYPAGDLAKTFYASAGGNMDSQARRQALVASGVEVEGYDEGAGDYVVTYYDPTTGRKQRTYAMRVPAYQRAYKASLTAGPMRSFGALLQSISAALAPAIAEWIRTTQPNDAAKQAEQAWHTEWQRILGLRANEAAGA